MGHAESTKVQHRCSVAGYKSLRNSSFSTWALCEPLEDPTKGDKTNTKADLI